MRDLVVALNHSKFLLLSQRRNSRAAFFTVLFPLVLFLFFASVFGKSGNSQAGSATTASYFLGAMMAYAIMSAAFTSLCIGLVSQREMGLLKRFRATPAPAWSFLLAHILSTLLLVFAEIVALLLLGWSIYGINPTNIVAALPLIVLGTFAMSTLAFAVTTIIKDSDSASSIPPFVAVMLSFISGVFISVNLLPSSLETIGRVFPLAPLAQGLIKTFTAQTTSLTGEHIIVLALWGLVGLVVAHRAFKWDPQSA